MARICQICGKGPAAGRTFTRRGLAKKKGGIGRRIVRSSKRRFLPNLQKVKAIIGGGKKTITVCTECIKAGKVVKG